jgi:hypothetical protein
MFTVIVLISGMNEATNEPSLARAVVTVVVPEP